MSDHPGNAHFDNSRAPIEPAVNRLVGLLAPSPRPLVFAQDRLVEDLGYNSLSAIELAYALEELFKLPPILTSDASKLATTAEVYRFVDERLAYTPTAEQFDVIEQQLDHLADGLFD